MSGFPNQPWIDKALQHHQAGRVQQAEEIYRQVLAREPDNPDALHLLGVLAAQMGYPQDGLQLVDRATALAPRAANFHLNRGNILRQLGRFDQAVAAFRHSIALKPDDVMAHVNLGNALRDLGRRSEAIEAFRGAIRIRPDMAEAHSFLGNVLREMGRLDEAIAAYSKAVELRPDFAELISNLGIALGDAGRKDEAIATFERAIALKPSYAEAHVNFSQVLRDVGRLEEAVVEARCAVALRHDLAGAYVNLGNALVLQGRSEEAVAEWRSALVHEPGLHEAHSNLLLALHNRVHEPKEVFEEHRRWARMHAAAPAGRIRPHANDRNPNRRLRVGYVSSDFREHPVGRLFLPVAQAHDREQVEVICYSQEMTPDPVTAAIRAAANEWHKVDGLTDADFAELVRGHRIDLLIDLAGHTAGNRLRAFAQKPAPVQVTWLGYPDTSGVSAIDYRITDTIADPPGASDALHTEKVVRLEGCFLCLRPLEAPIESADRDGHFTFGCFNNFTKASPQVMRMWARVLHEVPHARMVLKSRGLTFAGTNEHVKQMLLAHDVPIDRVELLGHVETVEHLPTYNRVDVALDTFPYSGTATTCDALSMGAAVVTLTGNTHASRVSASLLTAAGLSDWVAGNEDAYVRLAVEAAAKGLRSLEERRALREWVKRSPLCDEQSFARRVEHAYREMWQSWCRGGA